MLSPPEQEDLLLVRQGLEPWGPCHHPRRARNCRGVQRRDPARAPGTLVLDAAMVFGEAAVSSCFGRKLGPSREQQRWRRLRSLPAHPETWVP